MNSQNWEENSYGLNLDVLKPCTYGVCRVSVHVGHTPTIIKWEQGQTRPNVDGIWWGRVHMCQLH